MKKLPFLFLIFIIISAFSVKDGKTPSMDKTTRNEMPRNYPVKVTGMNPESGIISVKKGSQCSVEIYFSGYPSPFRNTVLRGSNIIENSELFIIEATDRWIRITIKNIKTEDKGVYEVQLDNGYGSDSVAFLIKVID